MEKTSFASFAVTDRGYTRALLIPRTVITNEITAPTVGLISADSTLLAHPPSSVRIPFALRAAPGYGATGLAITGPIVLPPKFHPDRHRRMVFFLCEEMDEVVVWWGAVLSRV